MSNLTKVFSSILVICVLMTGISGCGIKTDDKQTNMTVGSTAGSATSATTSVTSTKDDPLAKYTPIEGKTYKITWMTTTNTPVDPNGEMVQYWNKKFNVDLQIICLDQNTQKEQLNLKLAAREIPDTFPALTSAQLDDMVRQGVVAELPDPVLKKYLPKVMAQLEIESPGITKFGYYDGKRYGVPNNIFMYNEMRKPLVYNGLWLQKLGVKTPPVTLNEFEKLIYRFTNEDPDGNSKNDTYGISKSGLDAVWGVSGYDRKFWHAKDGKAVYGAVQPEMKNVLTIMNKWYKDKVLDPEFITGENTGGYWALSHAFINGRIGFSTMGSFYHWSPDLPGRAAGSNYVEIMKKDKQMADALTYGQPPKGTDGKGGVGRSSVVTDSFFMLGTQLEKEPDKMAKIMQIIEYLNGSFNEESYITYFYGIKGKHWDYDKSGAIKSIGIYTDFVQLQKIGCWGVMGRFGLAKNNKLVEGALMDWGKKMGIDKGSYEPLYPGSVVFPTLNKFAAELTKIEDQAYISMITGDKPISYFDQFVSDWNKAGGDQVTKEINDWYQKNK